MDTSFFDTPDLDRVDGRAKVTGAAKYAAEHPLANLCYGVLVGTTIAKGTIRALDTKAAERAPGVLRVVSHLNAPKLPGYGGANAGGRNAGQLGLKVFDDDKVRFYGQPLALVVADTYERALHAASLIRATYQQEASQTSLEKAIGTVTPLAGPRFNDSVRGEAEAVKTAMVKVEGEYRIPLEVHNPMELHAITVQWEGDAKVTVWEKTQGVKSTQRLIMQAFGLEEKNVQVFAEYVGGGFGAALRTWPHAIAALTAARMVGRPMKLVLGRDQMFTLVGYRPAAIQRVALGADKDGKLQAIYHEAHALTSTYEDFSEGIVAVSRALYACPNVTTRYKVYPLDLSTPTWMRGPGEATGAFALESALDELAYQLAIDPLELRLRNYAETDPERGRPFSSKFLKEAYQLAADRIGWKERNPTPRSMREGDYLVGFGMGTGMFNASRGGARAAARLMPDGTLVIQSAVSDSGPGTATAMTQLASEQMGIAPTKIRFELGDSSLPPGPTQGGSTTTSTLGSAVVAVCAALKERLAELVKTAPVFHTATIHEVKLSDLVFDQTGIALATDRSRRMSYADALRLKGLSQLEVSEESKAGGAELAKYATYSYSVHFVKVLVHPLTGVVRVARIVIAADAGKIVNHKTAESQMIGGAVGGIGMALTEEGVIDHRYGKWINNNFADYHVPVHADVPPVEVLFVNKPDPIINPMGAKGLGEIALIGFSAAVANAVFHATGRRVRELPITPDKLL
jgi:xanthine dehydrogenase YagR molybdenum-binding subunit